MKKKVVSLLAAMALAVSTLAGCGAAADSTAGTEAAANTETTVSGDAKTGDTAATTADTTTATAGLKAGFIFLHDENSTYDLNFMNAAKEACEKLGVECVTKTNIPEGQEC